MAYKVVAGRGSAGSCNWGGSAPDGHPVCSRPTKVVLEEAKELRKYIGKKIRLGGGGGWDTYEATLKEVEIVGVNTDEYMRLIAHLEDMFPSLGGSTDFSPWIDSWQIMVEVSE